MDLLLTLPRHPSKGIAPELRCGKMNRCIGDHAGLGDCPPNDTFGRGGARLAPEEFHRCFLSGVQAISEITVGKAIGVDGNDLPIPM